MVLDPFAGLNPPDVPATSVFEGSNIQCPIGIAAPEIFWGRIVESIRSLRLEPDGLGSRIGISAHQVDILAGIFPRRILAAVISVVLSHIGPPLEQNQLRILIGFEPIDQRLATPPRHLAAYGAASWLVRLVEGVAADLAISRPDHSPLLVIEFGLAVQKSLPRGEPVVHALHEVGRGGEGGIALQPRPLDDDGGLDAVLLLEPAFDPLQHGGDVALPVAESLRLERPGRDDGPSPGIAVPHVLGEDVEEDLHVVIEEVLVVRRVGKVERHRLVPVGLLDVALIVVH